MKYFYQQLILLFLLSLHVKAYAQAVLSTPVAVRDEKNDFSLDKKQKLFISSLVDANGLITKISVETAIQASALKKADRFFRKISPSGEPLTSNQLEQFIHTQTQVKKAKKDSKSGSPQNE